MAHTQTDPFGTAELRRRVLDGWADSAARFREDANAEEDHALGGYRDRAVVELAQNAADAARRAGAPGRLRLALRGRTLTAANTGAALTPTGVESLATLRASAKRDGADSGSTGHFGVGFAAVAAIGDDVTIASGGGAVRWDRAQALDLVRDTLVEPGRAHPDLAAELDRRGGQVPLLRLPFAADERPAPGYDTEVTVVLRDEPVRARMAELLSATGAALLLALPALAEVEIDVDGTVRVLGSTERPATDPRTGREYTDTVTTVRDPAGERVTRWRTVTRSGRFDPALLADRPTEERSRTGWSVTWAAPVDDDGALAELPTGVERVVYAPTPSDEGLALPALLIGTFPMAPDRRRIAPGPVTDVLIAEAVSGYCALLCSVEPRSALGLVPTAMMSSGEFDGRFRRALAEPLVDTPFLVTASGEPVRPRDAVLVEGGSSLVDVLAELIPAVLPGHWNPRHPGLAELRPRRLGLAELADLIAALDREPVWWARLYAALRASAGAGSDLGELGALPVPLLDGRLVRGPRGLLMPVGEGFSADSVDPGSLAPLGLRIVHPQAADALLVRLGAVEANERAVLTDPLTRAAVQNSLDADDPDLIAAPVLELVSVSGATTGDAPWLAELALRDDDGGYSLAGELLVPDSPLLGVFSDDAPFGIVAADLVERYGVETLEAVGVLRSFTLARSEDLALGSGFAEDDDGTGATSLDGVAEWAEEVLERLGDPDLPPIVTEFVGVRDLEFVRADRWDRAMELLAAPGVRQCVVEPARVLRGDGRGAVDVPSYTAWWLRTGSVLAGHAPAELRAGTADPALSGLYDAAPAGLDPELARALGVRGSLDDLMADPDGPDDLLERLADPERHLDRDALRRIWAAFARVDADRVAPPARIRAVHGGAIVVADAEDAAVVDRPDLLPLLTDRPVVLVPAEAADAVADVLDLALASEEIEGRVGTKGEVRSVPDEARFFLGDAALTYLHHEELAVDGVTAEWFWAGGHVHAATTDGLARGLCWAAGHWQRRHLLAAVLRDPQTAAELLAEQDLDPADE